MRGHRSQFAYTYEDMKPSFQWQTILEDAFDQVFQKLPDTLSDHNANINLESEQDKFVNLFYKKHPWREIQTTGSKNAELEDVNLDEFEKILNGG